MKEQILSQTGKTTGSVTAGLTEEQVLASRRLHGANVLTNARERGFFGSIYRVSAIPL